MKYIFAPFYWFLILAFAAAIYSTIAIFALAIYWSEMFKIMKRS